MRRAGFTAAPGHDPRSGWRAAGLLLAGELISGDLRRSEAAPRAKQEGCDGRWAARVC